MPSAVALVLLGVVLAWPGPRLMARLTIFRRAPRAALVVWQAVSLAAVLCALAAGPAVIPRVVGETSWPGVVVPAAATVSLLMLGRLLYSGHRVGTGLRGVRRRHRELVDVIGTTPVTDGTNRDDAVVRVLEHPTPTAYCLPGLRRRVVLSQGTITALPPEGLAAVLAHERAHLRARHDLVLEFFTVLHTAVPRFLRSEQALTEVRLLVEVLADRAAVRVAGVMPLARSLVALAQGAHPEAALAAGGSAALARMELLGVPGRPSRLLAVGMYAFAAVVVAAPLGLLAAAYA